MIRDHALITVFLSTLLLTPALADGRGDGGKIAFYSVRSGRDDIYIMDADGSDVQLVTKGAHGGKCPDLSPDGLQMVFVSLRDGDSELFLMDMAAGTERCLTNVPSVERQPAWSPDGRRIAFQSDRDGNYEIYTMDADGADWRRLTFSDAEELWPHWSPDGDRIVFNSFRDGNWEIYVVDADGTNLRRLTNTPDVNETGGSWSPDGTRIAFRSGPPRQFQGNIHVMNIDGTGEIELTDFDGVEENPVWSPGGGKIVFQSMMSGNFELYVMDADGSNLTNLTRNPAHDYWPSWVAPGRPADVSQPAGILPAGEVELRVLYDDVSKAEGIVPGRGFSCLVKAGDKTLLLDTGGDGEVLMSNAAACGIDPADIDIVVISHCNSDHIGGLPSVLRRSGASTRVYIPGGRLPGNLAGRALELIPAKIDSAMSMAGNVVRIESLESICPGVMSTGLLGDDIPEQSLVVRTEAGAVVITGCAHPGIDRIVNKVAEMTDQPVLMVLGGFHLVAETPETIDRLAAELEGAVEFIAPCHCSGDLARGRFRQRFNDRCLELGGGSVLRLIDLVAGNPAKKERHDF